MPQIDSVTKLTDTKYINLYMVEATSKTGRAVHYNVASRNREVETLKLTTRGDTEDGVIIYALYGEKKDRVVLVRQYRYTIGDYVYELPAGLCEAGEDFHRAAVRELHEETGLAFTPVKADPMYEAARFSTIGMTDESVAIVYGYASGEISLRFQEDTEEMSVILADRQEVRRILREEKVAMPCAYQMMHFIHDEEPFAFLHLPPEAV